MTLLKHFRVWILSAAAAAALLTAGCQTQQLSLPAAMERCTSLGYLPGSDAHAVCVLDHGGETAYAEAGREGAVQRCIADSYAPAPGSSTGDKIANAALDAVLSGKTSVARACRIESSNSGR